MVKMNAIKSYLNVLKESSIIGWKAILEYKANMYASLIVELSMLLSLLFGYVFLGNFGDLIGWDFIDYLVFIYFIGLQYQIHGAYHWPNTLHTQIPEGRLNNILHKPKSTFFLNYFSNIDGDVITFFILDLILILPFVLIFAKFTFISLILAYVISTILGIFLLMLYLFIDSFNLYFLKSSKPFEELVDQTRDMQANIPGIFFSKTKLKLVFMLVSMYYVSTLVVPIFQGKAVEDFGFQIVYVILSTVILFTLTLINWHFGLKKYEAYN
jgi:hypothetical protein